MNIWIRLAALDLLRNRRFALFFVLNLSIGLAGITELNAFNYSIEKYLGENLKEILGADIAVSSPRPLNKKELDVIDRVLPDRQESLRVTFFSMISGNGISRLARIVAVDDGYPLYGAITFQKQLSSSTDAESSTRLMPETLNGTEALAWPGRDISTVLNIKTGDTIRIGTIDFKTAGIVLSSPGSSLTSAELAPVIHIGISKIEETGLARFGSRIRYTRLYRLPPDADIKKTTMKLRREIYSLFKGEPLINIYNCEDVNRNLSRIFGYFTGYLGLVAIVALFLAGIGTAYLFRGYLNTRIGEIAILMSLGAARANTYMLFIFQLLILGLGATLVSMALSFFVLPLFPEVMKGLIPENFRTIVNPGSLFLAFFTGIPGSVIFCLPVFVRIYTLKPAVLLQGLNNRKPSLLYESLRKRLITFMIRCGQNQVKTLGLPMAVYMKVSVRVCFSKDFQSSLWSGKKYAPAMPVYMKVSVNGG